MKTKTRQFLLTFFAILCAALCVLVSLLSLDEWVRIGVTADPALVESYHFGGEAMVAHGGWRYRSASLYAWSAFGEGLFALGIGALLVISALRRSKRGMVIGIALAVIVFLAPAGYSLFGWGLYCLSGF
jgi:hypothetical protein